MVAENRTFYFRKLVRDETVPGYEADPTVIEMDWRILTRQELKRALIAKIHEEADEIPVEEDDLDEVAAEIGDLKDVVDALAALYGISEESIAASRRLKNEKRGGFASGHHIDSITVVPGSYWEKYCSQDPAKYPEE